MSSAPLSGRVTLVTGASRGIGYASALALAKAGSHVIALARTQGGLEDLDDAIKAAGGECTLVPMDLKNLDGIDQLGGIINERWGRLDGLFANAGVLGEVTLAAHTTPKTWDEVMTVNLAANYRLIRSLDTLLRASPLGRAVFRHRALPILAALIGAPMRRQKPPLRLLSNVMPKRLRALICA